MATHISRLPWRTCINAVGKWSQDFVRISHVEKGNCMLKSQSFMHMQTLWTIRNLHLGPIRMAKLIETTSTEKTTMIEGRKYNSEKKTNLRHNKAPTGCPLCEFQDTLTYKDVLILHQFLSPDGRILPRHVTGMCRTMQWKLKNILYQSYSAGLLPDYKPDLPINENRSMYSKDYKWRKNNVYYDDFSLENPL